MFYIYENFIKTLNLEENLEKTLIKGAKVLYEEACTSGFALGFASYDKSYFDDPKTADFGVDAADVNPVEHTVKSVARGAVAKGSVANTSSKGISPNSNGTRGGTGKSNHGGAGKFGGTHHASISKSSNKALVSNQPKSNFILHTLVDKKFGKFVDKLNISKTIKEPVTHGFDEFLKGSLGRKFNK